MLSVLLIIFITLLKSLFILLTNKIGPNNSPYVLILFGSISITVGSINNLFLQYFPPYRILLLLSLIILVNLSKDFLLIIFAILFFSKTLGYCILISVINLSIKFVIESLYKICCDFYCMVLYIKIGLCPK